MLVLRFSSLQQNNVSSAPQDPQALQPVAPLSCEQASWLEAHSPRCSQVLCPSHTCSHSSGLALTVTLSCP